VAFDIKGDSQDDQREQKQQDQRSHQRGSPSDG
jgi:hypothetical protein